VTGLCVVVWEFAMLIVEDDVCAKMSLCICICYEGSARFAVRNQSCMSLEEKKSLHFREKLKSMSTNWNSHLSLTTLIILVTCSRNYHLSLQSCIGSWPKTWGKRRSYWELQGAALPTAQWTRISVGVWAVTVSGTIYQPAEQTNSCYLTFTFHLPHTFLL
jgi:hypothetical protein